MVNNVSLERVNSIKFLDVDIDSDLSWIPHINRIQSKLSSAIGILCKIRHKITTKAALLIYDAIIGSHLYCCNIVWASNYKTTLNKLYVLQKRALKICLKLSNLTHSRLKMFLCNPKNFLFMKLISCRWLHLYTLLYIKYLQFCFMTFLYQYIVYTHSVRCKNNLHVFLAKIPVAN